ncbi:MAG: DNA polymerase IV, partial [Pseudomonadota bacterium]|nr:DNA polymerase IV [Pseudomonadota bacterium]
TKNFKSISRSKTINNPTQLERKIYKIAKDLLTNIKDNEEYRLIGVGISELIDENFCDLDNLIDTNENNEKKLDQAINSLRDKFGSNIINHGKNYE